LQEKNFILPLAVLPLNNRCLLLPPAPPFAPPLRFSDALEEVADVAAAATVLVEADDET
jgi:hypothetical protein